MEKESFADNTFDQSSNIDNLRIIEYDTTPPKMPVSFEIQDLPYVGEMKWFMRLLNFSIAPI